MKDKIDILVIEDELNLVSYFDRMASLRNESKLSYYIKQATTLDDGINECRNGSFDVVLLDLGLPDSKGFDTLTKVIKNINLPIIVLSGKDDEEIELTAIRMGAQDYIAKNKMNIDILERTIKHTLARFEYLKNLK